jgi:hypothetical protein
MKTFHDYILARQAMEDKYGKVRMRITNGFATLLCL